MRSGSNCFSEICSFLCSVSNDVCHCRLLRLLPIRLQQMRLWLRVQREDVRHQLLPVRSLQHQLSAEIMESFICH